MTVSSWMEKILHRIDQNGEILERSLDVHDTLLKLLCGHKYMDERTMQKIQSRDTPTGKSAEFLSWLSSCSADVMKEALDILRNDKQHHVVNLMEGNEEELPLSDDIKSVLYKLTPRLNACMDADNGLLEMMLSKEALKLREYEAVKTKPTNTEKVNALLDVILRKSIRSFNYLIDSLMETNQEHIANELQTAIKGLDVAEKPKTETRSEDSSQGFSEVSVVHGTCGTTKIDGNSNVNGFHGSYLPTELPEFTPTQCLFDRETIRLWFRLVKRVAGGRVELISWKENEQRSKALRKENEQRSKALREEIERMRKDLRFSLSEVSTLDSLIKPISEPPQKQVLVSGHQNSTDDLLRVLREKFCSTESLTTLVEAILIQLNVFGTNDEVLRLFREKFRSRESLTTLVEAILSHLLNTGNQSSNVDPVVNGKRRRSNASQSTQFATNDAFLSILKKRRTHNGTPPFHCFNDGVHNHLANLIQVG